METQLFQRVNRELVAEKVYCDIRGKILRGEILQGTRLLELNIATQMGVSRSPVREALRRLEAEGLVDLQANLGVTVRTLSLADIEEIYTARSLLEGYAAGLAAEHGSPEEAERLQDLGEAMAAAHAGDECGVIDADFQFHSLIWDMSRHKIIRDIMGRLEAQIRMFMCVQVPRFTSLSDSVRSHQAIVDAIRRHDREAAKLLMERHINDAAALAIDHLRKTAEAPAPDSSERESERLG